MKTSKRKKVAAGSALCYYDMNTYSQLPVKIVKKKNKQANRRERKET